MIWSSTHSQFYRCMKLTMQRYNHICRLANRAWVWLHRKRGGESFTFKSESPVDPPSVDPSCLLFFVFFLKHILHICHKNILTDRFSFCKITVVFPLFYELWCSYASLLWNSLLKYGWTFPASTRYFLLLRKILNLIICSINYYHNYRESPRP